ncbi:VRR-NUC domain-containing protein [Spirosoma sp. HMF4905]|uniref:VRR-NUC domain-containing protein n=1 Tax=Spirosoma arboris TaxID=2682092 RepID=A0A7K1SBN0_9BACT|nr:VRR-NUC domain-containing protein [Spirosoma arboris]MVM31175.1 VRR-NUC domain-containing protein [Spirosoma arboris]
MNQLPAFRQLQNFIGANTARKSRLKGPKPETANALTKRLISFLRNRGHFAARINTTGLYDEKLGKYRPSGATTGVPDVISCIEGHFVGLEIKIGADRLSKKQQQIALQINSAGGFYLIVRSFDDFEKFYAELITPSF